MNNFIFYVCLYSNLKVIFNIQSETKFLKFASRFVSHWGHVSNSEAFN